MGKVGVERLVGRWGEEVGAGGLGETYELCCVAQPILITLANRLLFNWRGGRIWGSVKGGW